MNATCKRCGGSLWPDEDALSCFSCGATFYETPPKLKRGQHRSKKRMHGQHDKTLAITHKVIELYHSGLGFRSIAKRVGIAGNTARTLLRNNVDMIDFSVVLKSRKTRQLNYTLIQER